MSLILAVISALLFGTADFTGGVASRRNAISAVLIWSQIAGLVLVLVYASLVRGARVGIADLAYGAVAGIAGLGGLAFLYRGLARGLVAIVSPLAAVGGAVIPLGVGLILGETFTAIAAVGVGVSLVAILLVSWHHPGEHENVPLAVHRRVRAASWRDGAISGILFGIFFVSISQASAAAGLWPLAAARFTSISLMVTGALISGRPMRITDRPLTVGAAGLLDMGANIALVLAYAGGFLSLVTVVASAYPAQTVLLSRLFFGERIGVVRLVGIVLAIAGVALISLG